MNEQEFMLFCDEDAAEKIAIEACYNRGDLKIRYEERWLDSEAEQIAIDSALAGIKYGKEQVVQSIAKALNVDQAELQRLIES